MASATSSGADGAESNPNCTTNMPGVGGPFIPPLALNWVTFRPASIV